MTVAVEIQDAEITAAFERLQQRYMPAIFADALGYAGCAMIRRTLGPALPGVALGV